MQDTEQEPWLSCLQPLYDVKTLSPEDPANLAKSVGLGWPKEVSKIKEGKVGGKMKMKILIMITAAGPQASGWESATHTVASYPGLQCSLGIRLLTLEIRENMAAWLKNCEIKIGLNAAGL